MTWANVVERQRGAISALLAFEGLPYSFCTDGLTHTALPLVSGSLPTQLNHTLDRDSVQWGYEIDLRENLPQMPSCTFRLKDISRSGVPNAITDLLSGPGRANMCRLRATLAAGATTMTVDSTSAFPSSGTLYLDQETITYSGTTATTFTGLTRGRLFSHDVAHTYAAFSTASRIGDFGLTPSVYDRPVSWIGRKAYLFIAEVLPSGALSGSTVVWRGRIKTAPALDSNGLVWTVNCESLWDTVDNEILSNVAVAVPIGYTIDNPTIDVSSISTAGPEIESATLPSQLYFSGEELAGDLEDAINTAYAAFSGAFTTDARVSVTFVDGRFRFAQTEAIFDGLRTISFENSLALTAMFGPSIDIRMNGSPTYSAPLADAVITIDVNAPNTIPIDNATGFVEFSASAGDAGSSSGYDIRSIVTIGDIPFFIDSIDTGANTITVTLIDSIALARSFGNNGLYVLMSTASEPMLVKQGLMLAGGMPTLYEQFLTNSAVPEEWRGGLYRGDFDWDDMELYVDGSSANLRRHIIAEPISFRKILLSDMRFAGLVPSISTDANLTWRPLALPTRSGSVGNLDNYSHSTRALPEGAPITERVVNEIKFVHKPAKSDQANAANWTYSVSDRTRQQLTRFKGTLEFPVSALAIPSLEANQNQMNLLAERLMNLLCGDSMFADYPCTIRAGLLLPMDTVELTHPTMPDYTAGRRGIDSVIATVVGIKVSPFSAQTTVKCFYRTDTSTRGRWGPAARITAYTNDGAGAGALRHRLTVDPGYYSDTPEGNFFKTGMKVRYWEWNDSSSPRNQGLTITADGTDTSIYVSATPTYTITGGTWIIVLDNYETTDQTDEAKDYAFICDEDDGLIATSGVRGYSPS